MNNTMRQAPELRFNGDKKAQDNKPFYTGSRQDVWDYILHNLSGVNGNPIKIMIVLMGTNEPFKVSEKWILDRTGMAKNKYHDARKLLVEKGMIFHDKQSGVITVNIKGMLEEHYKDKERVQSVSPKNVQSREGVQSVSSYITNEDTECIPSDNSAKTEGVQSVSPPEDTECNIGDTECINQGVQSVSYNNKYNNKIINKENKKVSPQAATQPKVEKKEEGTAASVSPNFVDEQLSKLDEKPIRKVKLETKKANSQAPSEPPELTERKDQFYARLNELRELGYNTNEKLENQLIKEGFKNVLMAI